MGIVAIDVVVFERAIDGAYELSECRLEVPLAVNGLIMYKD